MTYKLTRGATCSLAFEDVEGGDLTGATCRADLKKALNGGAPGDLAEVVATFTVTLTDEVTPGGWAGFYLTLSPEQTAALTPGNYVTDAMVTLASGYRKPTDVVQITVVERVTV